MKHQIKINNLVGWSQLTANILRSIADFNANGEGLTSIEAYQLYVRKYNSIYPKGIFNYNTERPDTNTLEIYADDILLLSFTMCEVHELVTD